MGLSQATWTGLQSIVAFTWGAVVFKEVIRNLPLSITGTTAGSGTVLICCIDYFGNSTNLYAVQVFLL